MTATPALAGRVALVTGASSGIGAGVALDLARRGAHVVLVARRRERLEEELAGIREQGGSAEAMVCDVTDESAVRDVCRALKQQHGRLDLLVNNAGMDLVAPLQVMKLDDARAMLELNVLAVASVSKACGPMLKTGAAVVNVASAAALKGSAAMSMYAASKGAVASMTRSLAVELAPRGVRVNAVAPGVVRTELFDRAFASWKPEQIAAMEARHPLGFGRVEDVAAAVAFLGSDEARWITGQVLAVDGGFTA